VTSSRLSARHHSILAISVALVTLATASQVALAQGAPRTAAAPTDCRWRVAAAPLDRMNPAAIVEIATNDVWAAGQTGEPASTTVAEARHFDGTKWTNVPLPVPGTPLAATATASNDVWLVGASPAGKPLFEHWNGTAWTATQLASGGNPDAVSADSPSDAWAVGNAFRRSADAYHFNGTTWSPVTIPTAGTSPVFGGVLALAGNDVWVVGFSTATDNTQQPLIEHWNGTSWAALAGWTQTGHNVQLTAIGGRAGDFWVGGFDFGVSQLFEHWDGSTFTRVSASGTALPGSISVVASDSVWVSGYSVTPGDEFYLGTDHWDGSNWTAKGSADGAADKSLLSQVAADATGAWATADGIGSGAFPHLPGNIERYSCQAPLVATAAAQGTDSQLWYEQPAGNWHTLGGHILGSPAVVSAPQPNGADDTYYIATGTDRNLWVRDAIHGWQPLSSSPVQCIDAPAAAVVTHRLYVACQGTDHALWYAVTDESAGYPHATAASWQNGGGVLTAGPAVASIGGVPTFLGVGSDRRVWQRTDTTAWSAQPWYCQGRPALASDGPGAHFACDGTDGALWRADNAGSGWGTASSLGGRILGGVGVATIGGTVTYFAEGTDQKVYERLVTGSTISPWQLDGGQVVGGVGAGPG
jgi:hypothetical protein